MELGEGRPPLPTTASRLLLIVAIIRERLRNPTTRLKGTHSHPFVRHFDLDFPVQIGGRRGGEGVVGCHYAHTTIPIV